MIMIGCRLLQAPQMWLQTPCVYAPYGLWLWVCRPCNNNDNDAGVIGGVVAFTVVHVAKLILDWLATKTGCCAPATTASPLEAAEEFHVTPNGDAKPPPTAAEPVSPAQTHPAMHIHV